MRFPERSELPESFKQIFDNPLAIRCYLAGGKLHKWEGDVSELCSPIWLSEGGKDAKPHKIADYPLLGEKECGVVLDGLEESYEAWAEKTISYRAECVKKFLNALEAKKERLAVWISISTAKPLKDALAEVERTVKFCTDLLEEVDKRQKTHSRMVVKDGFACYEDRTPLGLVLSLPSWNYPINEGFTPQIIPALLAGNVVVVKPPSIGGVVYHELLEDFLEYFPPGVVNVVWGREVVHGLMRSGRVNVLAFIGGTETAKCLMDLHPNSFSLRRFLGLSAKNPAILLEGLELTDRVVREVVSGAFGFNGQRCTALKIIFCHESILEEFLDKFAKAVEGLEVGLPWESGVRVTPLPSLRRVGYMEELLEDAKAKGAEVLNPGGGQKSGTFYRPAVLYPLKREMRLYQEEQFGPLVGVLGFREVEEVVEYVRTSPYGQQLSLFGEDDGQIGELFLRLGKYVGSINVNKQCKRIDFMPFGGKKESGRGFVSVYQALDAFSLPIVLATGESEMAFLKKVVDRIREE